MNKLLKCYVHKTIVHMYVYIMLSNYKLCSLGNVTVNVWSEACIKIVLVLLYICEE